MREQKLSPKQRTFCLAYAGEADGNGTEAARIAGYKGNEDTLKSVACENLTKPYIKAFIEELRSVAEKKLQKKIMSAAEVKAELSEIALVPWNELVEIKMQDGEMLHASVRLADKIKALELMGKIHGLYLTKIEITTSDADKLIDGAVAAHGLPAPETFGGLPVHEE